MPPQIETESQFWPAPAKLNLFLHVLGRGSDGYHELQTLFQILDWGDKLRITVQDNSKITRQCDIDDISASEDICIRAARLLQSRCAVKSGAHIELYKRIPLGSGLGGGSSDAATVLVALNKLWDCGLSSQDLVKMGMQLGADVPVFIHGHSAWAEGRGEKLSAVCLGDRYYLLVFPPFGISTAEIFRHPELKRDSAPLSMADTVLKAGRNDCLAVARKLYPRLETIMLDLQGWGHPYMTGTGSTIFLPFDSKKAANSAASELKCRYNICAVGGLDKSALLERVSSDG